MLIREWVRRTLLFEQALDEPILMSTLKKLGYGNIKRMSSRRFAVLIDGSASDRSKALKKIETEFESQGAVWDKNPQGPSSIGMVKVGQFSILAKPASRQGGQSAGLGNESILVDTINDIIAEFAPGKGGIDIEFVGPGAGRFSAKGVTAAVGAGAETTGRKKSDVNLTSADGVIPLSIKQDNACYWESADTSYGSKAATKIDELLDAGTIEMVDKGGYYNIVPNIAVPATPEEATDVVFGSDILGQGVVIKKTFGEDDFSYDAASNRLSINATYMISDLSHVTGDHAVWFLIRNDKTRKSVPGWPGIRVLAAYEKRCNKNVMRVE